LRVKNQVISGIESADSSNIKCVLLNVFPLISRHFASALGAASDLELLRYLSATERVEWIVQALH
jgi:hypothetical protein